MHERKWVNLKTEILSELEIWGQKYMSTVLFQPILRS